MFKNGNFFCGEPEIFNTFLFIADFSTTRKCFLFNHVQASGIQVHKWAVHISAMPKNLSIWMVRIASDRHSASPLKSQNLHS